MAKKGRPSLYSDALADDICQRLINGESLNAICKSDGMPSHFAVFSWIERNPAFAAKYARARELQAEKYAEEIVAIADEAENDTITDEYGNEKVNHEVVARARLRVDARKWVAAKLLPKKYGEKIEQEVKHGVSDDLAAILNRVRSRSNDRA